MHPDQLRHSPWSGVPRDVPAGSTRIIAFAAIATRRVDYEKTAPIIPPHWAKAPVQHPSPPSPKTVPYPYLVHSS